jgi:hypothetical protein
MRVTRKLRDCRDGLLAALAVAALCLGNAQAAQAGSGSSRESFSKWLRCPSIDQRGQLSHRDGKDAPCKFVVDYRTKRVVAMVRGKVNNHSKRRQIHKNCGLVPPSVYGGCNWTRELYSVSFNGLCSGVAYGQLKNGSTNHKNQRSKQGASKGKGKGKGQDKGQDYRKDKGKGKEQGRHYGSDKGKGKGQGRDYAKGGGRDYDKGRDHGKDKGRDRGGKDRGGKGRGGKGGGGNGGGGGGGGNGNNDVA